MRVQPTPTTNAKFLQITCLAISLSFCACRNVYKAKTPTCSGRVGLQGRPLSGESLEPNQYAFSVSSLLNSNTKTMADLLSGFGVRAVFFVNGERVLGGRDSIDAILNGGHIIGNGLYEVEENSDNSETAPTVLGAIRTDALLGDFLQRGTLLLRLPSTGDDANLNSTLNRSGLGKYSGPIVADFGSHGRLKTIDWMRAWSECLQSQLQTTTSSLLPSEACARQFIKETNTDHGLFEFTDISDSTVDAARAILKELKYSGNGFVAIDSVPDISFALENNAVTSTATDAGATAKDPCSDY